MVRARYAFGRVTLEALDQEWVEQGIISTETAAATAAYCRRHTGMRCRSFADADAYVVDISDGQTFGLERD